MCELPRITETWCANAGDTAEDMPYMIRSKFGDWCTLKHAKWAIGLHAIEIHKLKQRLAAAEAAELDRCHQLMTYQHELGGAGQRLAGAEARIFAMRQLLETAVDAWECGMTVSVRDGVVLADYRAAILTVAWHGAARKLTKEPANA